MGVLREFIQAVFDEVSVSLPAVYTEFVCFTCDKEVVICRNCHLVKSVNRQ